MPPVLFLALLPAKRKTARFAFRAAKPGLCPALRGLLFALGGQRLPGLCAHAGLRRLGAGGPHGTLEARRFLRRGPRGNSRAKAQAVPVRAAKGIHLCVGRFGAERHLTNRVKAILFALLQANPERPLEQHGEAGMRTSHLHPSFPKQAQRAPAGNGQPRRQVTDGMRRARTTNRAVFLSPCHDDSTRQSRCQSMAHAVPLCYTVGRAGLRHFFKRRGAGSAGRAAPFLS